MSSLPQLQMPQIESPLDNVAKALSVKDLVQRSRVGDIQVQQAEQGQKDQQTVMQVLATHNGDLESALPELSGKVSPQTFMGLQKAHLETVKTRAELDSKDLENQSKRNGLLLGLIDQVKGLSPEEYAAQWPQIATSAVQIDPSLKAKINPNQPVPQAAIAQLGLGLMTEEQYNARELAKRQAAEAAAELPGKQAKTAQDQLTLIGQMLGSSHSQKDWDSRKAYLKSKGVGDDLLGQIPNDYSAENVQAAKDLALSPEKSASLPDLKQYTQDWLAKNKLPNTPENRLKAHQAFTNETKVQPGVMRMEVLANTRPVQVIDPNNPNQVIYTSAGKAIQGGAASPQSIDFRGAKDTTDYFTKGKGGQQLTAFNTAITHLDTLDRLGADLQNTDIRIVNRAKQEFAKQTGGAAPANFDAAKNAMSGEVAAALKASGATDQEIGKVSETFDKAQSPAQLKGSINTYRELLKSKEVQLKKQYDSGMQGKPAFDQPSAITVTDPRGVVHSFPNQQAADQFKKAAGIQ